MGGNTRGGNRAGRLLVAATVLLATLTASFVAAGAADRFESDPPTELRRTGDFATNATVMFHPDLQIFVAVWSEVIDADDFDYYWQAYSAAGVPLTNEPVLLDLGFGADLWLEDIVVLPGSDHFIALLADRNDFEWQLLRVDADAAAVGVPVDAIVPGFADRLAYDAALDRLIIASVQPFGDDPGVFLSANDREFLLPSSDTISLPLLDVLGDGTFFLDDLVVNPENGNVAVSGKRDLFDDSGAAPVNTTLFGGFTLTDSDFTTIDAWTVTPEERTSFFFRQHFDANGDLVGLVQSFDDDTAELSFSVEVLEPVADGLVLFSSADLGSGEFVVDPVDDDLLLVADGSTGAVILEIRSDRSVATHPAIPTSVGDAVADSQAALDPSTGTLLLVANAFDDPATVITTAIARHLQPPSAVRNVTVEVVEVVEAVGADTAAAAVGKDVRVSWDPPEFTGGQPLTGYTVTAQPGPVTATVDADSTSVVFSDLEADVEYTFTVAADNAEGRSTPSQVTTDSTLVVPVDPAGYWMLEADGTVYPFGTAGDFGGPTLPAGAVALRLVPTPSNDGYWVLHSTGQITAHGDAAHLGDLLTRPVELATDEVPATMSATPDGTGYWIFTNRGRVVNFGSAGHFGDLTDLSLSGPIIASVATPTGLGYYMVGSDGGIFALGDAQFRGSIPGAVPGGLNQPIVGISPTPDNAGYWLVAEDGGIFAFGAPFRGSIPGVVPGGLNQPINGMVAFGNGYLLVASDGGVFTFSDLDFLGSLGANPPDTPVVAISPLVG